MNVKHWKLPPLDPEKKWLNRSIELQILLACNWRCIGCDQGSQFGSFDFVRKGTMTMEQIDHFANEMLTNNAYIGRIRVMGGEPSVHPKFHEILKFLTDKLVNTGHIGRLEIITNGANKEKLNLAKPFAKVRVSGEEVKQSAHVANLVNTPESLGYEGKICSAPWHCGMSLNFWGYFPCSSGAGISRFEDWMVWQRLTLPTCTKPCNAVMETWPELQKLCNHCYHALRDSDKIKCGTFNADNNKPGEHIREKIEAWKAGKKVEWSVYGQ